MQDADADDAVADAGRSAFAQSVQLALQIDCVERQWKSLRRLEAELRRLHDHWQAGARGERAVAQTLARLVDVGWHFLLDRRWPGTHHANIDVILACPAGVFVIDVKNWREPRVERGRLWRGQTPADDHVEKLEHQARAVRSILAEVGLAPAEVVPVMVLAGRRRFQADLGAVRLLGEADLEAALLRRGRRLAVEQLEQVVAELETGCPPIHPRAAISRLPTPRTAAETTNDSPGAGEQPLLDLDEAWNALLENAAAEPVEAWMTWLHPTQARLITRTWSGPARIRGAAGTGKTVVALHRARHLAEQGRHVLFTSYVRSLGPVTAGLLARLAPGVAHRVHCASVHHVADRLLRQAGNPPRVDKQQLDQCLNLAWSRTRRDGVLEGLGHDLDYWRAEISQVIKGRGIADEATYATLRRVGRRTPLQPVHRAAVWRLLQEYERERRARGLMDFEDMLNEALAVVRSGRVRSPWDCVIVDEVQDLTCVGLQLLHALSGDRADGLLMVGDGQQSVYPGGFTLAEAGISVTGRAVVLEHNYRNADEILQHALALMGEDTFDDLDATPSNATEPVRSTRAGGEVVQIGCAGPAEQDRAVLDRLTALVQSGVRIGDIALLAPTNRAVRLWQTLLGQGGFSVVTLDAYDGRPVDAVKVGTFHRAKGLDFGHVLIPDRHLLPHPPTPQESDDGAAEEMDLERRRLFVAMTRARDSLWLSECDGTTGSGIRPGARVS